MRPRIGLDARMVDTRTSGLGRYARELIRRLPALAPGADFVIIKRPVISEPLSTAPNVTEAVLPGLLDHPANLLSAPGIDRLRLDLYHSLHHFLPPGLRAPRVVMTLHDLIWVEHAELTFSGRWAWPKARANQVYGTATMWHALRRADHIIAISAHSRDRAIARFHIPADRFTVIHHGVDHEGAPDAGTPRPEPPRPFLLSLGNSKPYKNLPTLLRAFAAVLATHPALELVIVGRGDSLPELRRLSLQLGVDHGVTYTGMIDDAEVHALMRAARALVFPSLIEGFGFPAVEAMAAGCPVVTSDIPVMREIVGDAALLAPPTDPEALAAAIRRVVDDGALREDLRNRGTAQALTLRWDEAARQTAAVYEGLLPDTITCSGG